MKWNPLVNRSFLWLEMFVHGSFSKEPVTPSDEQLTRYLEKLKQRDTGGVACTGMHLHNRFLLSEVRQY